VSASARANLILAELHRHECLAGPYFNLRCKCGHVEKVVSRPGDFEIHLADALDAALLAAGFGPGDTPSAEARQESMDVPEDERHTAWCRGDHEGPCRRGRLTGTEKPAAL
jgi:hypothetical protein